MTPLHLTLCNGLPYELVIEHPITVWEGNPPEPIRDELTTSIINPHHLNYWEYCKPILRRLSIESLKEKIVEYNGVMISTAEYISTSKSTINHTIRMCINGQTERLRYWQFERLLRLHFNVFNLPDSDFIPVTNEFNPYK